STLDAAEAAQLRRMVEEAEAFLIDEVGAEHDTEWAHARFGLIIHARWRAGLPSVVTSNLPLDDLTTALGERAADRLLDDAIVIRYAGPSRRGPQETT